MVVAVNTCKKPTAPVRKELSKISPEAAGLACVASVSVANFDLLAARKLGREQTKKEGEGGGEALSSCVRQA